MAFNRPLINNTHILPEGEYEVKITKAEDCISQNSGKDMIKLSLFVLHSNLTPEYLTQYIVDDEYADEKIIKIFKACGKQTPAIINSSMFVGLTGMVKTKNAEYNGQTRPEIHYWKSKPAGTQLSPATPAQAPQENPLNDADNIPF